MCWKTIEENHMVTLKKRRVVLIELFFCCQNMHPLWFSLSRLWLRRRRLKLLVYRGCHKCAGGNHTSVFSQFFLSTFGQQFTIQRSRCSSNGFGQQKSNSGNIFPGSDQVRVFVGVLWFFGFGQQKLDTGKVPILGFRYQNKQGFLLRFSGTRSYH